MEKKKPTKRNPFVAIARMKRRQVIQDKREKAEAERIAKEIRRHVKR